MAKATAKRNIRRNSSEWKRALKLDCTCIGAGDHQHPAVVVRMATEFAELYTMRQEEDGTYYLAGPNAGYRLAE